MTHFSGKFVLRCSQELHRQLVLRSRDEGVSLNKACVRLLEQNLKCSPEGLSGAYALVLQVVRDELKKKLLGLAVFGSAARNELRVSSDVDLLIVIAKNCSLNRDLYRFWDERIAPRVGPRYAPHFVHLTERDSSGSLWFETALEGIVLYDPDFRLHSHLSRLRRDIAEGCYQRRSSHGHPYWVRKRSR